MLRPLRDTLRASASTKEAVRYRIEFSDVAGPMVSIAARAGFLTPSLDDLMTPAQTGRRYVRKVRLENISDAPVHVKVHIGTVSVVDQVLQPGAVVEGTNAGWTTAAAPPGDVAPGTTRDAPVAGVRVEAETGRLVATATAGEPRLEFSYDVGGPAKLFAPTLMSLQYGGAGVVGLPGVEPITTTGWAAVDSNQLESALLAMQDAGREATVRLRGVTAYYSGLSWGGFTDNWDIELSDLEVLLGELVIDSSCVFRRFAMPKLRAARHNITLESSVEVFSAPSLEVAASISLGSAADYAFSKVEFPSLRAVPGQLQVFGFDGETFVLPALEVVGRMNFAQQFAGDEIRFPKLRTIDGQAEFHNAVVGTIDLSRVERITGSQFVLDTMGLTGIDLSSLKEFGAPTTGGTVGDFTAAMLALPESVVDHILVRLAALDGTNGTVPYVSGTVDLSGGTTAPPSSTGLAAKAALVARGVTVNTND